MVIIVVFLFKVIKRLEEYDAQQVRMQINTYASLLTKFVLQAAGGDTTANADDGDANTAPSQLSPEKQTPVNGMNMMVLVQFVFVFTFLFFCLSLSVYVFMCDSLVTDKTENADADENAADGNGENKGKRFV